MPAKPIDEEELQAGAEAQVEDMAWFGALVRYKQLAITALLIRTARRRGQENSMRGVTRIVALSPRPATSSDSTDPVERLRSTAPGSIPLVLWIRLGAWIHSELSTIAEP